MSEFANYSNRVLALYNTGNPYTERGQRITIWELSRQIDSGVEKVFLMYDRDRMIQYVFQWEDLSSPTLSTQTWGKLVSYVHSCYDFNKRIVYDYLFGMYSREVVRKFITAQPFPQHRPARFYGVESFGGEGMIIKVEDPGDLLAQAMAVQKREDGDTAMAAGQYNRNLLALVEAAGLVVDTFKRDFEIVAKLAEALEQFQPWLEAEETPKKVIEGGE